MRAISSAFGDMKTRSTMFFSFLPVECEFEIFLGARAVQFLGKNAKKKNAILKNPKNTFQILARPQNARQCILPIQEMLFDYLIAIVAQKAEILKKLEN